MVIINHVILIMILFLMLRHGGRQGAPHVAGDIWRPWAQHTDNAGAADTSTSAPGPGEAAPANDDLDGQVNNDDWSLGASHVSQESGASQCQPAGCDADNVAGVGVVLPLLVPEPQGEHDSVPGSPINLSVTDCRLPFDETLFIWRLCRRSGRLYRGQCPVCDPR